MWKDNKCIKKNVPKYVRNVIKNIAIYPEVADGVAMAGAVATVDVAVVADAFWAQEALAPHDGMAWHNLFCNVDDVRVYNIYDALCPAFYKYDADVADEGAAPVH